MPFLHDPAFFKVFPLANALSWPSPGIYSRDQSHIFFTLSHSAEMSQILSSYLRLFSIKAMLPWTLSRHYKHNYFFLVQASIPVSRNGPCSFPPFCIWWHCYVLLWALGWSQSIFIQIPVQYLARSGLKEWEIEDITHCATPHTATTLLWGMPPKGWNCKGVKTGDMAMGKGKFSKNTV